MILKSKAQSLKNAYTDAPELHPNLILGSLQLFFWLFFHPSAWRNHIARIDPGLRPDFCLVELSRKQWRSPVLRRLLIIGYVIWPLLIGLLISLVQLGVGQWSGEVVMASIADSVMRSVSCGVMVGITVSLACGMVCVVTISAVVSTAYIVGSIAQDNLEYTMALAVGIALGVIVSVVRRRTTFSLARRIGSAVLGGLAGSAILVVIILVMYLIVGGIPSDTIAPFLADVDSIWYAVTGGLLGGVVLGVVVGWRTGQWRRGLGFGVVLGMTYAITSGASYIWEDYLGYSLVSGAMIGAAIGMRRGIWSGVRNSVYFALPYAVSEPLAGPWTGMIAGALAYAGVETARGIAIDSLPLIPTLPHFLVCTLLGVAMTWWRPVLIYPFTAAWNFVLYRADERRAGKGSTDKVYPRLLRFHSAFWDEHQWLPHPGLEDHLVLAMERNPDEGQVAMEYVASSRWRRATQAAQIELDARQLERCADTVSIARTHNGLSADELQGPASALLREFSRVSHDVAAALHQGSNYHQRLALNIAENRLDSLVRELTRSSERHAMRFHPIAVLWHRIVADRAYELAEEAELRQEIANPYIIGIPLTEQQEVFVERTDVSARIEELLLDQHHSPVLLYGQRRMGKTSLLNNLGRLLPSTIVPLFVDLQGPVTTASDHAGLFYNIARCMSESATMQRNLFLPPLTREALTADPFTRFDEWMDEVEQSLERRVALLALDEFEALDSAIAKGRFDEEAVLGTLRHLIQHHPRFQVLLSGSHTLEEVQRWASYLVNVQMVHIGYLKEADARRLIEQPIQGFPLRYEPDASQRVLDLTRGHPFLVQLLCTEIVALKNRQPSAVRRLACLADVETAAPQALIRGCLFFVNIERNRVDAAGLNVLRFLAAQGERAVISREAMIRQFPNEDELDHALDLLGRRELIEPADGGYRFQVELVRRWFVQGE